MVKLCFEGHVYEFGGVWYQQTKGGPIGLRLSGAVAGLVMIVWDDEVCRLVKENKMVMELWKRYVDDGDTFLEVFEKGWRWEENGMKWALEHKEEDMELNEEDYVRVMREFRKLCNSIWPWIQVKEDVGSKYEDGKLPILDLKVYVEEKVTEAGVSYWVPRWSFFEKPMKSKFVIMRESAMGEKTEEYKQGGRRQGEG